MTWQRITYAMDLNKQDESSHLKLQVLGTSDEPVSIHNFGSDAPKTHLSGLLTGTLNLVIAELGSREASTRSIMTSQ